METEKGGGLSNIINLHSLHLQWPMRGPWAAHCRTMGMWQREDTYSLVRLRRGWLECWSEG